MRHYRTLLRTRHALRLIIGGTVARYPLAMMPLALLLLIQGVTGSYVLAGLAAGLHALASAVGAQIQGRLADRLGARVVLLATGSVYPVALWGAVLAADGGWPFAGVFVLIGFAGAVLPTVSPVVRTIWRRVDDDELRQSAYALDAVAVEIVFISGPALVALCVALWSPAVAVVLAAVAASTGAFLVATSAWVSTAGSEGAATSPIRSAKVVVVLITVLGVLFGFGTIEVAVAAFTGGGALAGVLLALWAVGSVAGGLWFGSHGTSIGVARRYGWALVALAAAHVPLVLAAKSLTLAVLLVLAGFTIAPTMALQAGLMGEVAPAGATTEAFTWLSTVGYLGLAAGAAVGGYLVESPGGVDAAFLAGAAGSLAALLAITVGQWMVRRLLRPVPLRGTVLTPQSDV